MISIILFSVFLVLFFIKQFRNHVIENRLLPPGPRKLPFIGNLHLIDKFPHRTFQHLSTQYGPLLFMKLGSIPTLVVSSAEMAREIFRNHDNVFSDRPVLYAANRIGYNGSSITVAPYGDYWKGMRKILFSELLSAKRVQSFQAARLEEVKTLLHAIHHSSASGSVVNLSELTLLVANNVVCRVAFGTRYEVEDEEGNNEGSNKFSDMLRETQELLGGFCLADFFPCLGWLNKFNGLGRRIEKNFAQLDKFYDKVIKEHVTDNDRVGVKHDEDLVDVLLRLQKDQNLGIAMDDDQIRGVLTDIFVAGTDTASATMIWTMSELIRNPEAMKRAQEEVREVAKNKEMVEESDLSRLIYLNLVLKEALRMHPPAPLLVPRETTETCMIKGYRIPARTRVFINAKTIATDPTIWENPNEFLPERFLDRKIDFRGPHFEMLPFGAGRRGCPGVNFAMPLIELVLANLLFRFDWELPNGVKMEELDMEEAFGITMHKKAPLWLKAIPFPLKKINSLMLS